MSRLRIFGFDTWLRNALFRLKSDPNWRDGHFRPQVQYECFDCEVFRYEDGLQNVSDRLSSLTGIGIPAGVSPENVSPPRPVHISQVSLEKIAQYYTADFERFGYDVDLPQLRGVTKS